MISSLVTNATSLLHECATAYPLCTLALVYFSYLTSPFALLHLVPIVLIKLPAAVARTVLGFFCPSLFEKSVVDDVVYITGAASGIGRLLAFKFAEQGATVVLVDKDEAQLAKTRAEMLAIHDTKRVHAFACDLAVREETYETMHRAAHNAGPCTILINNAGIVTGKKLLESPDELIELSFRVNSLAHFWTIKAALPAMLEANRGHIVTVASSAGLLGVPGLADYCASKFAAVGLDESLRLELRKLHKTGVKTTCVCPLYIDTGMFEGAVAKFPRFAPFLSPEYAASKIVRAVRCNQQMLIMPFAAHLTPLLKGLLPSDVAADIADWFGVLDSMDAFKGRAAPSSASRAQAFPVGAQ